MAVQHEPNPNGMRIFTRSTQYMRTHYHELREKYPDHWIAIYNGEVVGASLGFHDLFDDLKAKGIPLRHTFIDKIETERVLRFFLA